jgi:hypothetical protein
MGSAPQKGGEAINGGTDLKEVELTGAHARHPLADGGLDGGPRDIAVFEHAPFGAAEDGAGRELLLELPLSE